MELRIIYWNCVSFLDWENGRRPHPNTSLLKYYSYAILWSISLSFVSIMWLLLSCWVCDFNSTIRTICIFQQNEFGQKQKYSCKANILSKGPLPSKALVIYESKALNCTICKLKHFLKSAKLKKCAVSVVYFAVLWIDALY